MGAGELDQGVLGPVTVTARQRQAAALHIADRIAAEHPHPRDEDAPALAGQLIAKDPAVRAKVRDLINALGLDADLNTATNQRLKGGGPA